MAIELTDLPFILSVQRAGSLTGAARTLRVDHSTAFRKLRRLEQRLGEPLFDRLPGGAYLPTAMGQKLAQAAERLSDDLDRLNRDTNDADRPSGVLRITTSESIAYSLLMPHLRAFQDRHPALDLVLDVSNHQRDLARREADIAIRTVRPAAGALWGQKIARIAWAIYKRRGRHDSAADPAPYIGWDTDASSVRVAHWIEQVGAPIRLRTSSLLQQQRAARSGFGLAVLPCYLGDTDPELQRHSIKHVAELRDELWIVAHAQLRKTERIRALLDFIAPALRKHTSLIEGRASGILNRLSVT